MKKIICTMLVICLTFGLSAISFAETVNDTGFDISFTISDNWTDIGDSYIYTYQYNYAIGEFVSIKTNDSDLGYSIELADEEEIKKLCEYLYSDERIMESISGQNGNVDVTMKTNYVATGIEYYNNVRYFKYEKSFVVSAYGYKDTPFYGINFVTIQNGNIYFIEYSSRGETNHFADVVDMLNTLSYENGEIKIKIDDETIHPDSAPLLIEDRTMVPIRAVAEKMGYTVSWDEAQQLVTLTAAEGAPVLQFVIGSDTAQKDAEKITLDVPAVIVSGRTYLPLRAVAEAMDAEVNWNGEEQIVEITQK